ncbi:MAG: protein kinase domain-containing protein [Myxococcales bacterium]
MKRGLFVIVGAVLLFVVTIPGVVAYPPPAGHPPNSILEELVERDDSVHVAANWGAKGLFALGVVLLALAFNEQLARGHHEAPERQRAPKRREASGRLHLGGPAAEAERRGDYAHAAVLFDGLQDWKAAARCYAKAARLATGGSSERASYLQIYVQRAFAVGEAAAAVELLVELGDLRGAAELEGKLGHAAAQAELLARAGDPVGAAAVLEQAGDVPGAARVLEAAGDVEGAIALLGPKNPHAAAQMAEAHGDWQRAAEIYTHAGEHEIAAPLFLRAGDLERAVEVFRAGGDLPAAAEQLAIGGALAEAADIWLELGQLDKAAQAFQKLGDPAGLARALEKRGDHAGAARAFLQLNRAEEVTRVVGLMSPEQREAAPIRLLLGAAQLKLGKPADAIATVRPILARGGSESRARCESFYLLGLAHQQAQDAGQAIACFEQCLALDHSFRDVPLRLSQLRAAPHGTVLSPPKSDAPERRSTPPAGSSVLPQRYLLLAKIGEGAMGTVYKAKDSVLDRPVAIKVLNRALAENETARSYFLREARSAAAMSHPHIVTVFDAGFEGAVLYLVMEYLEGEDLESLATKPPGGLPEKTALRYAAQVADALAAVHAQNIVHRDVKPGNVMRVRGGDKIKLMDFGIAHLAAPEPGQRKSTNVAGTPDFMAPEQLLGQGLGPWTDVYALGGTLYELLTGQVPFPEGDATLHAHQTPPPDPRKLKPGLSAATAELVLSCLKKEPRERPQSAAALRDRLEKLATG